MRRFVLVEAAGSRWAVPEAAVSGLDARGGGVLLRLKTGASLRAEGVLGREEGGERPPGPVVSRFLPRGIDAFTVLGGHPVAVVDVRRPPECLLADGTGEREKGEGS